MSIFLTISKGKISIPKEVKETLSLKEDDILTYTINENNLVLRKVDKKRLQEVANQL